ncbi:FAD-dependent oxidoreductase [Solicola gregarius]|uniref:ferredoxin--NADP(+) reductase n=1 Tax=Solicola gregarius TaxID=2908642 RepID=A0AA46TM09_9ACTN|nr:FAD-dependent oxidoreductase [Solicola gregarius]UYM07399.1 FAD-dependent oxidoreductase [Solicola gregarius]
MPYAITQECCSDATCVSVCPVNCIHPTPDEPDFGTTEMLYVDPRSCIDCGACADACPVDAVMPIDMLTASLREYADVNAAYYEDAPALRTDVEPNFHEWAPVAFKRSLPSDFGPLRVAIVGTGPAGMYAAEDLLLHTNAKVSLIDRLPVAGGLVRFGVAPDHPSTKGISSTFERYRNHPRTTLYLGLEVGREITHEELAAHHDAVIYAVGASADRRLGVPGEDVPGSLAARTFVAWYNRHPDVSPDAIDLSAERIVVIGTGNVALDVARILTTDPGTLAGTDIAPHALQALRASKVREVVLLGRRGPEHAAYTTPELRALRQGVEVVVDGHDATIVDAIAVAADGDKAGVLRGLDTSRVDWTAPPPPGRRIVLRFESTQTEILGDQQVRAVRTSDGSEIPAGMVLRAIGYRGQPVRDLPFDEETATVPGDAGRVAGVPGTYVVGWIKRGPSGGIGANRRCAEETVGSLLADAVDGRLAPPKHGRRSFDSLARRRSS